MDEKTTESSMKIIIEAGDARLLIFEAMNAMAESDFAQAGEKLKQAQEKMTTAHQIQTDRIQEEAAGKGPGYSLLFTHAQDTLMTIYSELNITKKLLKVFAKLDERVATLERRHG